MSPTIRILHIGVPMDHPSIPPAMRPQIEQELGEVEAQMRAKGIDYCLVYASPESGLEAFAALLKERPCDGIVIGAGTARLHDHNAFLEQIVDVAQRHAPRTRLMFIADPQDARHSVARWFYL